MAATYQTAAPATPVTGDAGRVDDYAAEFAAERVSDDDNALMDSGYGELD